MPRMYVEGIIGRYDSPRQAAHKLMKDLDEEAAKAGHRITGDVSIYEESNTFAGATLRLEADVVPA